jgi:hypothetical protein
MVTLTITNIELAINYWREREGPGDGITLSPIISLLANVYGGMIYRQTHLIDTASLSESVLELVYTALNSSTSPSDG